MEIYSYHSKHFVRRSKLPLNIVDTLIMNVKRDFFFTKLKQSNRQIYPFLPLSAAEYSVVSSFEPFSFVLVLALLVASKVA